MVKRALSSAQVDTLNATLDQKIAEGRWHIADKQHRPDNPGVNRPGEASPQPGITQPINCRFGSQQKVGELLDWGPALTDLIDQPSILPILTDLCGAHCRLDHDYINVLQKGGAVLGLHGGGGSQAIEGGFGGGATFYHYADGRFLNGLLTVAYELRTVHKGDGGALAPSSSRPDYQHTQHPDVVPDAASITRVTLVTRVTRVTLAGRFCMRGRLPQIQHRNSARVGTGR